MGGKTIRTSGTKAEALQLQSSARGVLIPWVRGLTRISGNLVWYNGFKAIPHTETQGGKGGAGKSKNTTYTYVASVIMGLCHGPLTDVIRVWKGKQIYTGGVSPGQIQTASETYTPPGSGAMTYTVTHGAAFLCLVSATIVVGGEDGTQLLARDVDFTISPAGLFTVLNEALRGVQITITYQWTSSAITRTALQELGLSFLAGNVGQAVWSGLSAFPTEAIGYSGLACVAGQDYDLGNDASVENHMFEVVAPMAYHLGSTVPDVDPSLFVRELFLDDKAGAGLPTRFLGNWGRWSDYCVAANLLISPALTEQTTAADVLKRAADVTCSAISTSGGKIEVIPRADAAETGNGRTYTPNLTPVYDLNDECYTPSQNGDSPVKYRQKNSGQSYNTWSLEYRNRANDYATDTTDAKDAADIAARGVRANPSAVQAEWINNSATAAKAVQLMMQRSVSVLGEYDVPLPPHFSLIDLVDPLTLTDTELEYDRLPVLVIGIDEMPNGDLVMICEDYPIGAASAPVYATPDGIGYQPDYNADPGDVAAPVIFEGPATHAGETGVEVYIAVRGSGANWGGALIWTSLDGTNYKQLAKIDGPSRYGQLNGAVTSGATSLAVDGLGAADLNSGTAAEAAALVTLCYMGNADGSNEEFFAHQGVTLTGSGAYTLSGLVRGAYGTPAAAHTDNGGFVRIDERVARSGQLDPQMIGKTLHVKCTSFNVFGSGQQSLADVTDYTYIITGRPAGYVPGVGGKGLTVIASSLTFKYDQAGNASPASITLTAVRKGTLLGAVTWSVVSGTATLTGTGDTRTLTEANLTTDTVTIRASITDAVGTYSDDVTISKVRDGAGGSQFAEAHTANMTWLDGVATKVSGTGSWDGSIRSTTVYPGPVGVAFVADQNNRAIMVGLNSDPALNDNYNSIDYALYLRSDNIVGIYESGASQGTFGTYAAGDVFAVVYDGDSVTYYKNGSALTTPTSAAANLALYLDSSFNGLGSVSSLTYYAVGNKGDPGLDGADAPLLTLSQNKDQFTYDGNGARSPASQTITYIAVLQNVTGAATFTCTLYDGTNTSLGTVTLGGSGNTRTLSGTQFESLGATVAYAVVTATLGSLSDTTRAVKVRDGGNSVVPKLTNYAATFPADSDGNVSDFATGVTRMKVEIGGVDDSTNWAYSVANSTGVTAALGAGANENLLTVTAMTAAVDSGTCTITATKSGYPNQVLGFTLAKSKSAPGSTGFLDGFNVISSDSEIGNTSNATATVTLETDGGITRLVNDVAQTDKNWYFANQSGIGSSYWVYASFTGPDAADITGAAESTWLALSANRSWSLQVSNPTNAEKTATIYLKFATDSSGATIVGSGKITLFASREP